MKNLESGFLHVPVMDEYFQKRRRNEALMWIPVQCSILFCDELQQLCTATKYIYVAFMLICGNRGSNELPFNISYLARMAGVDRRTMSKGIEDLLCANLLNKRERQTEKKERTAQTDENADAVLCSVDLENSKSKIQDSEIEIQRSKVKDQRSIFSIDECFRYVEICKTKGEEIKNAKGLANHIFKTGEADAFILATLYPEKAKEKDLEIYGEPRQFSDEPCRVCFGAKMANPDGRGFRKCEHCRDEKGKATGFEPLTVSNEQKF